MSQPNLNTFSPATQQGKNRWQLPSLSKGSSVIVVGAGAFGGWTALNLLRRGLKVTLVDAWGPGNSRSSSGDETRVIRSTYGANETYFDLNVRALQLWKENEKSFKRQVFFNSGVLWLCYEEKTPLVDDSIPFAKKHGMEYRYLTTADIKRAYPFVNTDDLHHAWLDPFGGFLKARESCQAVAETFVREGGELWIDFVQPEKIVNGQLPGIKTAGGRMQRADTYVFACGAWLGNLFPECLGNTITCTKQEVYYFGVPSKNAEAYEKFPVWVDVDGKDFYYGIAGNSNRGFKIGVDRRGEPFDPTHGERVLDPKVLQHARQFIAHRFPELKHAPLVESRVCPYENSPDGNFIFDQHPEASNVFFLGGGSGHGFKHGPALGELVARVLLGEQRESPIFGSAR